MESTWKKREGKQKIREERHGVEGRGQKNKQKERKGEQKTREERGVRRAEKRKMDD